LTIIKNKGLKIMADDMNELMSPEDLKQLTSDILSDIRELKQRINSLEDLVKQHNNNSNSNSK
jgi:hypothetical protein